MEYEIVKRVATSFEKPRVMRIKNKIIRNTVVLLGLVLLVLLAFPMAIKDRLINTVKKELNKNLDAEVDFTDAHISLLVDFPNIRLVLDSLTINGIDEFGEIELLTASKLKMSLGTFSLLKNMQSPVVRDLSFMEPRLNILVLEDGTANYDIAKDSDQTTTEGNQFALQLKSYDIVDGVLHYRDRQSDITLDLSGLDHQGSGVLSSDVFDLDTEWQIEHLSLTADDVEYIADSEVVADAILGIDLTTSTYTFKENLIQLNDLGIRFDGSISQGTDDFAVDLKFGAPSTEIQQFLSMIPGIYRAGLQDLQTEGKLEVQGNVLGTYNEAKSQYPTFSVDLRIEDGLIGSTAAESIEALNANIQIASESGQLNDVIIDAQRLAFEMQDVPFSGRLWLTNLVSNPHAEGEVKGNIDLATLSSIIPLDGIKVLKGHIRADVEFAAKYKDIESELYDHVKLAGNLLLSEFSMESADYPLMTADDVQVNFSPQRTTLAQTKLLLGKSDLTMQGHLDNVLGLLKPDGGLDGAVSFQSTLLDANEWLTTAADTTSSTTNVQSMADLTNSSLQVDGSIEELRYLDYTLSSLRCRGRYNEQSLSVDPLQFSIDESDIKINGELSGLVAYFSQGGMLQGSGSIHSDMLNLDALFGGTNGETSEESAPYPLPPDVVMDLNLTADQVIYDGIDLRKLKGHLVLSDRVLIMERASAQALGGTLGFAGRYETQPQESPAFDMKFDATDLDFQETFAEIPFLKKIAPIGAFLQGELKSNLVLEGNLLQDRLYPELMNLSGSGLLETVNSAISKYVPLEKVSELLGIKELREIKKIKSKNWFSLDKGRLDVEPFDVFLNDLDVTLNISGSQFLDGNMDYLVLAKVPRELLRKNQVTGEIDRGYGLVLKRAKELGLNLEDSDYVTLQITLAGVYNNPTAQLKVVDTEGRTADQVLQQAIEEKTQELKDSVRRAAEEKVTSVRDSLLEGGNRVIDSLQQKVKKEAEKKIESLADSLLDTRSEQLLDSILTKSNIPGLGDSTDSKVSDIKQKLKDFNPFRKKKRDNEEVQDSIQKE